MVLLQVRGELEHDRLRPHAHEVVEGHHDRLADDRGHLGARRDVAGGQHEPVRVVEVRRQLVRRRVEAVADEPREGDFEPRPLRQPLRHGADLAAGVRRAGRPRLGHPGHGEEGERHAVHVGVLRREVPVRPDGVADPPQPPADDLLAEQLRAERPYAQDVRDRVGVPALGEHRHAHDAPDVLAELALLADGVEHLAHELLVGDRVGGVAGAAAVVGLEVGDQVPGELLEVVGQPGVGLELHAIDEDGVRPRRPAVIDNIVEQADSARRDPGRAVRVAVGGLAAGDVVVDELADGRVVADDDEDRRRAAVRLTLLVGVPGLELRAVVGVEALECPLQLLRQHGDGVGVGGPRGLLGQAVADVDPEVAVLRVAVRADHRVVRHGDARDLDDAGLDGVDEREVADHPGEQRALGVAGPLEVERRRRQVVDRLHAHLGVDRLQPGQPQPRLVVPRGRLLALLGRELLLGPRPRRPGAVAVVRLVVEDQHLAAGAQRLDYAVHHLAEALGEGVRVPGREQPLRQPAGVAGLLALEGVEVGDDDPRGAEVSPRLGGDEVEFAVVVRRLRGEQHAQPVADGDARRDDEEGVGEAGVLGVAPLVERLPGDDHRHDDRLARPRRHLARQAEEVGPGGRGGVAQGLVNPGLSVLRLLGHLGDEDQCLERLDLAEEQSA